jgi:hypothetical protein
MIHATARLYLDAEKAFFGVPWSKILEQIDHEVI